MGDRLGIPGAVDFYIFVFLFFFLLFLCLCHLICCLLSIIGTCISDVPRWVRLGPLGSALVRLPFVCLLKLVLTMHVDTISDTISDDGIYVVITSNNVTFIDVVHCDVVTSCHSYQDS